jgi:predicted ATPase with chaperone activity
MLRVFMSHFSDVHTHELNNIAQLHSHIPDTRSIQIAAEVPAVPTTVLLGRQRGTSTADFQDKLDRYQINVGAVSIHSDPDTEATTLLKQAISELKLNPRHVSHVGQIAKTIALLEPIYTEKTVKIKVEHWAEAIMYVAPIARIARP